MSDYGDFPDPDTTEYDDLAEDTEGWEKYTPLVTRNVFYPICLGEVLNQRYRLEHKLGHGGYSTVWMAHDLQNRTDVALKILAEGLGENEYHMQKEIVKAVRDISHLITYLDTFILSGRPDGNDHRVLVYSLHGPSLSMYTVQKKSMITRMSAARQLLQALKSLHNSGIVHHDLNPGNCMWGMISLNQLDRDVKYKILGRPRKLAIDHTWRPGELVKAVDIPEDLCTDAFYLGDFGLSLKLGTSVTESGFPPARYRSPDRDFNQPPSAACDIWSYMCLFSVLYCGYTPFYDIHSMIHCLGPLPMQLKGHYCSPKHERDEWYTGTVKPGFSLEARIAQHSPNASPQEQRHVLSIMYKCFSYLPERRPTATQLLQDPSFQAIMNMHCH